MDGNFQNQTGDGNSQNQSGDGNFQNQNSDGNFLNENIGTGALQNGHGKFSGQNIEQNTGQIIDRGQNIVHNVAQSIQNQVSSSNVQNVGDSALGQGQGALYAGEVDCIEIPPDA